MEEVTSNCMNKQSKGFFFFFLALLISKLVPHRITPDGCLHRSGASRPTFRSLNVCGCFCRQLTDEWFNRQDKQHGHAALQQLYRTDAN